MYMGSSLQILHIRVEPKGKGPPMEKWLLCKAVEISNIDPRGTMRILALEVTNVGG